MKDCSMKIKELRIQNNLTQAELGEKLNVTSQAVSKWENNLSEPDLDSLKKMSEIFNVSIDELLGAKSNEALVTESKEEKTETKTVVTPQVIVGYCNVCKKALTPGNYISKTNYAGENLIYCKACNDAITKKAKITAYNEDKHELKVSFIWASIVATILFVGGLIYTISSKDWAMLPFVFLGTYGGFAFTSQMFWFGSVSECFLWFCRSFSMPGVIFTLDWDGIKFLIIAKIAFAILGLVLSVLCFLLGCVVSITYSMFSFPFALVARINEAKDIIK